MSEENGLPKGWVETRLSQVIQPRSERVSPAAYGHLPFIGLEHIEAHTMRLLGTVVASSMKSSSARFESGDVLYGRLRPYLNKVYGPDFNGLCSAEFIVMPGNDVVDSDFLQFRLNAGDFVSFASHLNTGDRPRVDFDQLGSFIIRIPPKLEQRRIVAKIEELFSDLDAGVAALERAKANLKRYRAAVLKAAVEGKLTAEWRAKHPKTEPASKLLERILAERRKKWEADQLAKFAAAGKAPTKNWKARYVEATAPDTSGLPELPEDWCWVSVEQTGDVQGGIQKQPKRAPRKNSFPFLRVANVHRNRLDLNDVHKIELFGDELDRLRLQPDDLLVVEGNGSKTEIGRSAIWNGQIENCVHQNHIIRVRFLSGSSRYLNAYWNSPTGNSRIMERAASTSGLYTLSVTKVCSLPIPLPPLHEQRQIVADVERSLSVIAAAEEQIDDSLLRAAHLRQGILKQAFEGNLVPQDPTDEPASALLERLQNDRTSNNGAQRSSGRQRPTGGRKKRGRRK